MKSVLLRTLFLLPASGSEYLFLLFYSFYFFTFFYFWKVQALHYDAQGIERNVLVYVYSGILRFTVI